MATGGACGGAGDGPPEYQRTKSRDKYSTPQQRLSPDTEDNVLKETESVFQSFSCHMLQNEQTRTGDMMDTPSNPELMSIRPNPVSRPAQVGRQLAQIGDDINEQYAGQFRDMIKILNVTPDTAYDAFAGVARKLFIDGNINWGRIATLLSFGYRLAISVFQNGIRGFFNKIVKFIVKFILNEKIAQWIAQQGGWIAALREIPEQVGWSTIGFVAGCAFVSIAAAWYLTKR
ncbi:unnamed protein product [Owenia fusiformis]|uniref:Bcl-2 homologous antagonist/killer n=1 Tax=Owenia fusiformis TaxID=6347 RepID=A0A8J1TBH1_OWEFU|nr:unnamed protein product [Owenia fusiformis]